MQTSTGAGAAPVSRPRPPGSRRSSTRTEKSSPPKLDGVPRTSSPFLLPSPEMEGNARRPASASSEDRSFKLERDLDLDLPSDLTAALENSMQRWPRARHASDRVTRESDENEHAQKMRVQSLSVGRAAGERLSKEAFLDSPKSSSPDRVVLGELSQAHTFVNEREEQDEEDNADTTVRHHKASDSIDSAIEGSDSSFDAAWVGGLPREELEKLLFESRQIIKEREWDLGIAATIGKALLEKNISLRNRHEGIVSRFSSLNSMERLMASEDVNTPLPRYSPPHADNDPNATLDVGNEYEEDQVTPRPEDGLTRSGSSGYFQGLQASPSAVRLARINPSSTVDDRHILSDRNTIDSNARQHDWSPSHARSHETTSNPVSPSKRWDAANQHSLPVSETHRRLDLISEQNDELLEQIAQLQTESEKAKREGGRHQKKLIREIDGLRAELDAAQARNSELERKAEAQKHAEEGEKSRAKPPKRKAWRRRGTLPWQAKEEKDTSVEHSLNAEGQAHLDGQSDDSRTNEDADAELNLSDAHSESGLSTISRQRPQSEAERLIVAQLMGKVRELEEINSSLIRDAHERDGRIGRFMEDSERLRDMYDAVENEAVGSLSTGPSLQDIDVSPSYTPISSAAASPATKGRRAPGNRYLIEGRRTVRAAMRRDLHDSPSYANKTGEESSVDSCASSLNGSYLHASKPSRRLSRPRILITPSCEDLQAQARADKMNGWEDDESGVVGHPFAKHLPRSFGSELSLHDRFNDDKHQLRGQSIYRRASEGNFGSVTSLSSLQMEQRTLGSELGNAFESYDLDEDELNAAPQQDTTVSLTSISPSRSIRKTSSHASLAAMSEAASDIADLQWSTSSSTLYSQDGLAETRFAAISHASASPQKSLSVVKARPVFATLPAKVDDGNWHGDSLHDLIPRGTLKNNVETSHENYSLLEKLTTRLPVHWADDEDFGKPITERDARQLGLLEGPPSSSSSLSRVNKSAYGMLSWIAPRAMQRARALRRDRSGMEASMSSKRQIESVEDVARRHELERLLRARRVAALQDRVISGQLSADEARERGAFDYDGDLDSYDGLANYSFEAEVTQRAFAYRTMRRRSATQRIGSANASHNGSPSKVVRSPEKSDRGRAALQRRKVRSSRNPQEESSYEMTEAEHDDEDDGKGKGKARSLERRKKESDYYPTTIRERYRPAVVQQRVHQFSTETITLAVAWATFSIVMVLAFVSAFARGPKRLLYGQGQGQGRGQM